MNIWQERLSLLKYKGGLKAASFWLIKMLGRVEIHFFYAIDLARQQYPASQASCENPGRDIFHFISLNTAQDLNRYPHELIEQINSQSGRGVARLIREDAGVYALIQQQQVVSQTNIGYGTMIQVDSPAPLNIYLRPGDIFLGYLYTYPDYRGMGAAATLLRKVCKATQEQGYSRIVTHIRSTNAASLNTFKKCGWSNIGWIVTSLKGRLLLTCHLSEAGITISPARQAPP